MDANQFIDILEESKNKLLNGMAKDVAVWSNLSHTKEHLELFLRHNLVVVYFEPKRNYGVEVLVSSNPCYLSYINGQRTQKTKNKVVKLMSSSPKYAKILKSSDNNIVRTWNLITNDKVEIPMANTWAIHRWVSINEENIEALAIASAEILEKGKNAK